MEYLLLKIQNDKEKEELSAVLLIILSFFTLENSRLITITMEGIKIKKKLIYWADSRKIVF